MMSLEAIKGLRPAKFRFVDEKFGSTRQFTLGIMAQDVNEFYPLEQYTILKEDNDGNIIVDYLQLIAPMIRAIQELSEKIEILEEKQNEFCL